jgi:hypothetical protein
MPHIFSNRRKPATGATVAVLALLLACLGLVACGGSSKSSATNASASATTSTSGGAAGTRARGTRARGTRARGAGAKRFKAVRECLQKSGITLPQRTPGQRPKGGAGGFPGAGAGGPQLPKGVTRAQYEAAIKKCGGGSFAGRGARFDNPAYRTALTKFAACMRENGVNVPAPDTSGKGPIFSTKGIDTTSPQFKAAESKCSGDLRSILRRAHPDSAAPGAAPGAPPPGEAPAG